MISLLRQHRQRKLDRDRLKLIDALFESINEADPCDVPDCQHFRAQIHDLSRAKAVTTP